MRNDKITELERRLADLDRHISLNNTYKEFLLSGTNANSQNIGALEEKIRSLASEKQNVISELRILRKNDLKNPIKTYPLTVMSIIISIMIGLLIINPSFIGMVTGPQSQGYTQSLNIFTNESNEYTLVLVPNGTLTSARISGTIFGNRSVKVYLDDKLVMDKDLLNEENKGITSITGLTIFETQIEEEINDTETTQTTNPSEQIINETEEIVNETNENVKEIIIEENITVEENMTVEITTIDITIEDNITNDLADKANNVSIISVVDDTEIDETATEQETKKANESTTTNGNLTSGQIVSEKNLTNKTNLTRIIPDNESDITYEKNAESENEIPQNISTDEKTINNTDTIEKQDIIAEQNITKEDNLTDINHTIPIINTTEITNITDITINITNSTNASIDENKTEISFELICVETCLISIDKNEHTLRIVFDDTENLGAISIQNISYTLIPERTNNETENTTQNITYEQTLQGTAEIGKPVVWTKTIDFNKTPKDYKIRIPKNSFNLSAESIEEITSDNETGKTKQKTMIANENMKIRENKEDIEIEFIENITAIEINYSTEAPQITEKTINKYKKEVTISSQTHYSDILSYTNITESPKESIHLYWLVNGTKEETPITNYADNNGNGLIDQIEWITPHLSNETFIIEIIILNVQSYPVVGGNWTVMFNTTGIADLRIRAINGTTWSDENYDNDLHFIEIRCGEDTINTEWINDEVFYANYSCDDTTSYEISSVWTTGKHHLEFQYGDQLGWANNYAFNTTTQDEFNNGTYNHTVYNTTKAAVILVSNDSEQELPNNKSNDGWIDMKNNLLMMHMDGNISEINETTSLGAKLALLWHLNNNQNTDSSGNGNSVVKKGGLDCTGDEGKFRQGCEFDGIDDHMNITDSASLNFTANQNLTIVAWVKTTQAEEAEKFSILIHKFASNSGYTLRLHESTTNSNWTFGINSGTSHTINGNGNIADGKWHMLVGIRNGSSITVYQDGTYVNSKAATAGSLATAAPLIIGKLYDDFFGNTWYYNGSIDEVAIWNRSLSASEIAELYAMGNQTVRDDSGNNYHGNATNGAVNDYSGKLDRGIELDGYDDYINLSDVVLNPSTSNFSASLWIKPKKADSAALQVILTQTDSSGTGRAWLLIDTAGRLISYLNNSVLNSTILQSNAYQHVGLTYNTQTRRINMYVNGVLTDYYAKTPESSIGHLMIGISKTFANPFNGSIDEVAIWNRTLSDEEMINIYDRQKGEYIDRGTYTSEVFDAEITGSWKNLSASIDHYYYGQQLPNNKAVETMNGGANMTKNVLLMHLNNESEYNEDATTFYDFSDSGNNGYCAGTECPELVSSGILGKAYSFDGTDDFINVSNPSSTTIINGTVSGWIKTTNPGASYRGIVVKSLAYSMFQNNNEFGIYDWGTSTWKGSGVNLNDGQWHHVAVSFKNATPDGTKLYVDGTLKNTTNMTISNNINNVLIGSGINTQYFNGSIDEVAIWNRSLSDSEILDIYRRGELRLNISLMDCDDALCDGEDQWDMTCINLTYCDLSPLSGSRYIRYKANFEGGHYTPELYNITIGYSDYINVTLVTPTHNNNTFNLQSTMAFEVILNTSYELKNITLFTNILGSWLPDSTIAMGGLSNSTIITKTIADFFGPKTMKDMQITWNILAYNLLGDYAMAETNHTFSGWDLGTYNNTIFNNTQGVIKLVINHSEKELPKNMTSDWNVNMTGNVLLFHFNNDSDYGENATLFYDFSGNNKNGTCKISEGSCPTLNGSGKLGKAYSFDGNDNITAATISIPADVSAGAWVYSSNYSKNMFVVQKAPVNTQWELFFQAEYLIWRGGSTTGINCSAPTNNQWHHVFGTQTGTTATLYIDGAPCNSGTVTAIGNGAGAITIGSYGTGYYFEGLIDEVGVWNRTLSQTEIENIYNRQRGEYIERGTYTSKVFETNSVSVWKNITTDLSHHYYGEELPNNKITETLDGGANMTGNVLLMHLNENISEISNASEKIIGLWHLNNNYLDSSGLNHNGAAKNGLDCSNDPGKFRQGCVFDGTDDFINVTSTQIKILNGTVSAWIKSANPGASYRGIVVKNFAYGMYLNNGEFGIWDYTTTSWKGTGISVDDGVWHHVAISFRNGTNDGTKLYIDGNLKNTTNMTIVHNNNNALIGSSIGIQYFNGSIDEVAIWNRTLSDSEIAELYAMGNQTIMDDSGSNNNGNATDGVISAYGKFGTSMEFDGIDDSINISHSASLDINGSELSFSVWFKPRENVKDMGSGWSPILGMGWPGDAASAFKFAFARNNVLNDGKMSFTLYNQTDNYIQLNTTTKFTANKWYHVIGTYDGTRIRLYVDNVLDNSANFRGNVNTANTNLYIGRARSAFSEFFNGSIDEVAIWNRTLSEQEISDIYKRGTSRLNISVKDCDDALCNGENTWDAACTNLTLCDISSIANSKYLQYRLELTSDGDYTPEIRGLTLNYEDGSNPSLTIQSPINQTFYNSTNINLNYNAYDYYGISQCWYTNSTGQNITIANCINTTITGIEGYQNITVHINDTSNYRNSTQIYFTIDTIKPSLTVQSPMNATTYNISNASLNYTVSDINLDKCWYTNSTGQNVNLANCANSTFIATPGYQSITIYANDTAGNINSTTLYFTLNTPPTITSLNLNATSTYNKSDDNLTLWITATDPDNDGIKNITNWYKNNRSITLLNMPFEGGSLNGNTTGVINGTKDYSGHQNNGTVINATWNKTGGYDGKGAYNFDGKDDSINCGNATTLNTQSGPISASIWVKTTDQTKRISLIDKYNGSNKGWYLEKMNDNKIRLFFGDGTNYSVKDTIQTIDTAWHHIAMTYDGENEYNIYIDGINSSLTDFAISGIVGNYGSYEPLKIGRSANSAATRFNGTLDDVQIFNLTLSAEQILALYQNKTNTIVSEELVIGDNWSACVTPNDGHHDGATNCSNNITVQSIPGSTGCGLLDQPNTVYTLTTNVTSISTCFNITANNVTLDCAGQSINYSTAGILGYGVYAENKYNATIKNCNIYEGNRTTTFKNAVYLLNTTGSQIINNYIKTEGNNNAVYLLNSSNNTIRQNNISFNAEGVLLSYSLNNNISSNYFYLLDDSSIGIDLYYAHNNILETNWITMTSIKTSMIGIQLQYSDNNPITYNSLWVYSSSSSKGIKLLSSLNNSLSYNNLTVPGSWSDGIYMSKSNFTITQSNKINVTKTTMGGFGLYLDKCYNNLFASDHIIKIGADSNALTLSEGDNNQFIDMIINTTATNAIDINYNSNPSRNNSFTNITVYNTNTSAYDIKFSKASINETILIDTSLGRYYFTGVGGTMTFKDTGKGEIRFLQSVNGSGDHLNDGNESAVINIANNLVSVRSDINKGFNKSAKITMYNTNALVGTADKSPYRNGIICPGNICTEITDADTYVFNVTGFTNYSVGLSNLAPNISYVSLISAVTVTEGSYVGLFVNFTANDPNGAADLNDSSATAIFNLTGESIRQNLSCSRISNTSSSVNYSCDVKMWYFDAPGRWDVNVSIRDTNGVYAENVTTNFTVLQTTSGSLYGQTFFSFASIGMGTANTQSTNKITILNIGNKNFTLNVTAKNLNGTARPWEYLSPANFTMQNTTAGCDIGTRLTHNAGVVLAGANVLKGNNSAASNNGTTYLAICLEEITYGASSQNYSTSASGNWTVAFE